MDYWLFVLVPLQISCPIEAILVKVAAAGLLTKHIGSTIESMFPHLKHLRSMYGCNVCGEGGEYETLTLDCPLFKYGRIIIDKWKVITVSPDSIAPVALLHPEAFHVEPKAIPHGNDSSHGMVISVPSGFSQSQAKGNSNSRSVHSDTNIKAPLDGPLTSGVRLTTAIHVTRQTVSSREEFATIAAHVEAQPSTESWDMANMTQGAQLTARMLKEAFEAIGGEMKRLALQWDDSLFVHLYLPSMQHFSEANAAYLEIIPPINPPARACVQLDSRPGAPDLLIVEILYRRLVAHIDVSPATDVSQRKVLHVQSVSMWAPSCIGPYSQAVMHNKFVHLAGQIPLIPETMQVLASSDDASQVAAVTAQLQLVLRHCTSIAIAMQTDFVKYLLWGTLYFSQKAYESKSALAEALTSLQSYLDQHGSADDGETDDEGEGDIQMDSYLLPPSGVQPRYWEPLVLWIALPSLPRGVDVELQPVIASLSHMKNRTTIKVNNDDDATPDSEEEEDEGQCEWTVPGDAQLVMERVQLDGEASHTIPVQMLYYPGTEAFFRAHALITLPSGDDQALAATVARAVQFLDEEAQSKLNQNECGNWGLESCQRLACGVPNIKIYISRQKSCCVGVDDFRRSLPTCLQGVATIIPVIGIGNLNGVEGDLCVEYFLSMRSH